MNRHLAWSNETAPPQQLTADCQQLEELPLFAMQVQKQYSQQALNAERLKRFLPGGATRCVAADRPDG
ncbi:MAG: hypothetical protein R3B84_11480 [Zavarzinella sp.]